MYKNMVFIDNEGEYLSTDRGIILKILDFGYLVSGAQSEIKTVTLKNNNDYPVYHTRLSVLNSVDADGVDIELSKTSNPFKASPDLDYGNTVILPGRSIDFYIRIDTKVKAQAILDFNIDVNVDKYEENSIKAAARNI